MVPSPRTPHGAPPATATSARIPAMGYLDVDYRSRYAGMLRLHPQPDVAIAELCLFRFWLTASACHHALCLDGDGTLSHALPPPGWPLPARAGGHDIEQTLDAPIEALVESRFDLYHRFFTLGRSELDPLGLKAAALALACQLFELPSTDTLAWLEADTRRQFEAVVAACAGDGG